jgi:hypothetical protein
LDAFLTIPSVIPLPIKSLPNPKIKSINFPMFPSFLLENLYEKQTEIGAAARHFAVLAPLSRHVLNTAIHPFI